MKFGAKQAELGKKFVPRSRVRIFRNECTRFTPLDHKQMFWCVSYYLGAFGTVRLPYETWCKSGRTSAKFRATKSHRNFSHRMHPIHPFDPKLTIWVHLKPFSCLTKLGAKWAELVQKFVPQSRIGIFCNEHTRSTPWDPKLMFWCVLYYLGAWSSVWLRYETRCKIGRTGAKVRATKSRRNFSQPTHTINPIGP